MASSSLQPKVFTKTGGTNGGNHAKYYSIRYTVWEVSYDVTSNTSVVGRKLELLSGQYGKFSTYEIKYGVNANGDTKDSSKYPASLMTNNSSLLLYEDTITVAHETDGSKTIYCSAYIDSASGQYSPGDFSIDGYYELTKIPRYFTSAPTASLVSKTTTTAKINWSTSELARQIAYKIDNGKWFYPVDDANSKSGTITITGLTKNTSHTITVTMTRRDSGLWSRQEPQVSVTTYNNATITSAPNFNDENNPTINYTNPMGNLVTNLQACISLTGSVADIAYRNIIKTGTSYTFSLTEAERNVLRNATKDSQTRNVFFIVRTDVDGTSYYSSVPKTLTIINCEPVFSDFSFTSTDSNTYKLTGSYQGCIKNHTTIKVTISSANKATAKKGASILSYIISCGDRQQEVSYSTSDINVTLANVNSNKVIVYAKDSRGKTAEKQKPMSPYADYSDLRVNTASASRTSGVGSEVTLTFTGYIWVTSSSADFGKVENSLLTCEYYYKKTNASSYTTGTTKLSPTVNSSTGAINYSGTIKGDGDDNGFDASYPYDIKIKLADELQTITYNCTLNSGSPAMAIHRKGVSFGGPYNTNAGGAAQIKNGPLALLDSSVTTNHTTIPVDGGGFKFKGTYNRGGWNTPQVGAVTQVIDSTGNQHSAIVGLGEDGKRYYGIDMFDSYTNPIMKLNSGSSNLEIRNSADSYGARIVTEKNMRWSSSNVNNVNFNDFKYSGAYYMYTSLTNSPKGNYHRLYVNGNGGGDISQISVPVTSPLTMYFRTSSSGNWNAWKQVLQSDGNVSNLNLNSIDKSCIVYANSGNSNAPRNTNGFVFTHLLDINGTYAKQYFSSVDLPDLFFRRKYNGSWKNWVRIYPSPIISYKISSINKSYNNYGNIIFDESVIDKTDGKIVFNSTGGFKANFNGVVKVSCNIWVSAATNSRPWMHFKNWTDSGTIYTEHIDDISSGFNNYSFSECVIPVTSGSTYGIYFTTNGSVSIAVNSGSGSKVSYMTVEILEDYGG